MPSRGFTPSQISEMRALRKAGAPLREIAKIFGAPISTIIRYVGDIEPSSFGQETTVVSRRKLRDVLDQWSPALPWEGPPLPNWVVAFLKEKGVLSD